VLVREVWQSTAPQPADPVTAVQRAAPDHPGSAEPADSGQAGPDHADRKDPAEQVVRRR